MKNKIKKLIQNKNYNNLNKKMKKQLIFENLKLLMNFITVFIFSFLSIASHLENRSFISFICSVLFSLITLFKLFEIYRKNKNIKKELIQQFLFSIFSLDEITTLYEDIVNGEEYTNKLVMFLTKQKYKKAFIEQYKEKIL